MKELLTIKEAKAYLKVSDWLIRNMINTQGLSHVRLGKRILIEKADLDAWLDSHKVGNQQA